MACKLEISTGIWNIGIVSLVILLVYSATNPACALINTTLEDSDTDLTSKLGYFSESVMDIAAMPGAVIAPLLRGYVGYRMLISISAFTHAGLYIGMILLDQFAILFGSAVAGLGMGMIWVVIPNFVTAVSKHENIERNLSYHMFIYNFNGLAGNLLNYLCLDDSTLITSSSRIRYYTACTIVTIIATLLGGLGIRSQPVMSDKDSSDTNLLSDGSVNTKLLSDTDDEIRLDKTQDSHISQTFRQLFSRFVEFTMEPGVAGQIISNVYFGVAYTLIVMVPMCISNTYDNRKLIPLMGATIGICRLIVNGVWDLLSRLIGYRNLVYCHTAFSVAWLAVIFLVFPNQSSHTEIAGELPIIAVGDWVVYLIGVLTAITATGLGILVTVACGKVSRDKAAMHGFEPDVMFAYTAISWSVSSAITFAIVPYINLYVFLVITFVGLIGNHCAYTFALLSFIRVPLTATS